MIYLEYVWLDGNKTQGLRSKTKIVNKNPNKFDFKEIKKSLFENMSHNQVSEWNYDGSSTGQAETSNSELILKPVNLFKDPFKGENAYLVLCEVFNINGTPHPTNKRADLRCILKGDDTDFKMGLEQEYFIYDSKTNQPLGWPKNGYPKIQGDFYCGVGSNVVGREFANEHAELCNYVDIDISGINIEVALGQLEWQTGIISALDGSDQFWIARYIMERLSEKYGYKIVLHPKPFKGNEINGSGCHVNFSTKRMREDLKNKKALVIEACHLLSKRVKEHIAVYGEDNQYRLTGANETCSINDFKFGIGDRTASIRIPSSINDDKTPGYLEDRRPASNINPYEVAKVIIETIYSKENIENKITEFAN